MDVQQLRQALAIAIGVVLAGGLLVSFGWALFWRRSQLWSPALSIVPSWSLGEILLAIAIVFLLPLLTLRGLQLAGFFRWYYGADPALTDGVAMMRAWLWAFAANPFGVIAAVAMLHFISRTRCWQIGLALNSMADGASTGFITCLAVTPLVLCVHFLTGFAYKYAFQVEPVQHPLMKVISEKATAAELLLVVLQTTVFAPLVEEFIFRGLILPWAARRWWGGLLCGAGAIVLASFHVGASWGPLIFAAIMFAVLMLSIRSRDAEQSFWANAGCSLLFAAMHSGVWPTPIPLLFLALGLGWLRQRTQSLWGPIVMHGLFNSVSTLVLLLDAP